jgi:hypothetical protein
MRAPNPEPMMTPADRRITELIDKWLTSIDLHLKYVELSDAAYARVQPWPKHDRPTRWVLEVARQKALELKAQCETRQAMGDGKFSESLELMAFLANLVGIQHIQRFVPLADPARADTGPSASQTVEQPTVIKQAAQRARPSGDDTTREMPRLKPTPGAGGKAAAPPAPAQRPAAAAAPTPKPVATAPPKAPASAPKQAPGASKPAASTPKPAAAESKSRTDGARAPTRAPAAQARPIPAEPHSVPVGDMKDKIIADAVRLLKWGKSWHELTDLIERIAERPPASDIRKVLRANRNEIEKRAGQA